MSHAPGPLGSPQVPHDPMGSRAADLPPPDPTAKTEIIFSRSLLSHDGQEGVFEPKTIVSKRFEHFRHTYSKSGMAEV